MHVTHAKRRRYCLSCQQETDHVLIYLDNYLKAGRCISCGEEFNNKENLLNIYLHDMVERVLSKPLRVYQKVEHWPPSPVKDISAYKGLIKGILSKPPKEFVNIVQILKEYEFPEKEENNSTKS